MTLHQSGLHVDSLSFHIHTQTILENISFTLQPGHILGVLGPNGAGKSTLLKVISGQAQSDPACRLTGQVLWQQQSVFSMNLSERAQQIAVVNQINDPVFALSLTQIVEMGALARQSLLYRSNEQDQNLVTQALQTVGLGHKAKQAFHSLSGGEQQRGLIARALVQQASMMVLDEPVNHLDVYYQHQILGLLKQFAAEQGITIVLSLHDINLARDYCDQICLLDQGKLVVNAEPDVALQPELLSQVFNLPCHGLPSQQFDCDRLFFSPPLPLDKSE